ncbi:hypothetical protein [Meiothermus taiwanensis]|uniref:hypothetical protein n=1 Tax=Meiothermus taiwanensis TaxID=172827 RepID=UPI0007B48499|nr:hypothetical protein [Meiothermus taiwanensis]KZK16803.1 hypothetical protein A3962_04810 [Meiothermus taiwanensis]
MKRYIIPILSLFLTACTGSREEPTRALLAASLNNPSGSTYQVRFFQSTTLQPGSTDTPRLVGSWNLDAPIITLLYRRSLGAGNDQLWVLTPSRLRRYNASNLTIDDVGTPQLDGFDEALNVDCSQGYLRPGQSNILLVCPPAPTTPPRPIEEYRAWIIPFTATALPTPINFLDAYLVRLSTPARFTLGPNDQLLYLTPSQFGQYDFLNPFIERPLSLSTSSPSDLIFVNGQALGLFDDNDAFTTDTTLAAWNLSATAEVGLSRDSSIAARSFARGAPPVFVLGTGLARFEGGFQLPRESETGLLLSRTRRYSTAAVGIDQFLYLADQDSPTLLVIDLTVNIASALTTAGVRSSSLGSFQERISSLAFIPVE